MDNVFINNIEKVIPTATSVLVYLLFYTIKKNSNLNNLKNVTFK